MKKYLFIMSAAALALASCSEEQELVNTPVNQANRVLTATFEQDAATRTSIDGTNNNALTWSVDDEIAVYGTIGENQGQALYLLTSGEETASATFALSGESTAAPTEIVGAAFPYANANNITEGKLVMNLTSTIYQESANELDLPMWGTVTDGKIAFKHLAGVLKVNLTGLPDGYNKLDVTASNPISGLFTFDTEVTEPVLTSTSAEDNGKTVTVNFINAAAKTLYLSLPVGTYESIVVSVSNGTDSKVLKQFSGITVERAKVYSTSADISTYVTTAEELKTAVANAAAGATINLGADIELSEILTISKAITLNGNGFTLTSSAGRAINVETDGSVTIKNLNVEANGERAFNVINKPAKLTLEGVTATAKNYAVMIATSAGENATSAKDAATLTINNSNLAGLNVVNIAGAYTQATINNTYLTCNDQKANENYGAISVNSTGKNVSVTVNGGKITVKDDSYVGQSIADGVSITLANDVVIEKDESNTNYISYGACYIPYSNQTSYGFTSLAEALEWAKDGGTIVLAKDITITANTEIPANITIDGNGKSVSTNEAEGASGKGKGVFLLTGGTIKNVNFTSPNTQYDIIVKAGGSVIEGCKFETVSNVTNATGTTTYGKRAIYTGSSVELTGNLTVTGCTFNDQVYAFNFQSDKNKMDVTFKDCTLGGWLSGTGASHTFTNCTFKKSGEYANYIPYCPATFNGCTFEEGFAISLKKGSTYTFDDECTYNGTKITEPEDMKWDFSGGTVGTGDNGTDETVYIGEREHYWTNNVGEGTEGEATPAWTKSGNNAEIPV